jgi:hypothetical protein
MSIVRAGRFDGAASGFREARRAFRLASLTSEVMTGKCRCQQKQPRQNGEEAAFPHAG